MASRPMAAPPAIGLWGRRGVIPSLVGAVTTGFSAPPSKSVAMMSRQATLVPTVLRSIRLTAGVLILDFRAAEGDTLHLMGLTA